MKISRHCFISIFNAALLSKIRRSGHDANWGYDITTNNKSNTTQGLLFMYVFTGMFLKASHVIFYTSCSYNYLFSQGSNGNAFVLWQWKWKARQMLASWWWRCRLMRTQGRTRQMGRLFFFNLVTNNSTVRWKKWFPFCSYSSVYMPPTTATLLFYTSYIQTTSLYISYIQTQLLCCSAALLVLNEYNRCASTLIKHHLFLPMTSLFGVSVRVWFMFLLLSFNQPPLPQTDCGAIVWVG